MSEDVKKQLENLQEKVRNQEKLASLGLLSAGIVHEIRNPLNFVINFGKLSDRLVVDLAAILADYADQLSAEDYEEVQDLLDSLKENHGKIIEHGERAVSIIQNILLYSRGKEDEYVPTDVCKLVKEYVWLAYHAMRANLKGFNVAIEEDYQAGIPLLEVIPQDLSRAVLNIMNNACYAVWERAAEAVPDYQPLIRVTVVQQDAMLRLSIRDNGKGMPAEVQQRIFENFFTTKPVGCGTGLGMSIARDIIEKKHRGRIEIDSEYGQHTEIAFVIPMVPAP